MKNILVTGAAGFIGFHLAKKLAEDSSYSLVLADDLSRGNRDDEFQELLAKDNVDFVQVDLCDPGAPEKLPSGIDTIFHFAAIVGVANVMKQPYQVLTRNVQLLDTVVKFAQNISSLNRLVFTSTSEVYAGTLLHYGLEFPTPESTPISLPDLSAPRTSYMLSKLYGEAMCLQSSLPTTIVRPHNIYGPRMGQAHVIPELLFKAHSASDGDALTVFSPNHKRTFCFIEDAIEIVSKAAMAEDACNKVLNLGTESPEITMRELAELICKLVGKKLVIDEQPATPGSPERRAPQVELSHKLTGVKPRVGLEEGVRRTYEWYKNGNFSY